MSGVVVPHLPCESQNLVFGKFDGFPPILMDFQSCSVISVTFNHFHSLKLSVTFNHFKSP